MPGEPRCVCTAERLQEQGGRRKEARIQRGWDATNGACAIICLAGTEWLRELREERASARSSVSSLDARGRDVLRDSCDPLARYSLGFGLDVLGARPRAHANHASVACGFTGSLRQLCSCQTPPRRRFRLQTTKESPDSTAITAIWRGGEQATASGHGLYGQNSWLVSPVRWDGQARARRA